MMPPGSRFMARAPLRGRTVIMMAPGVAAAMERRRFAATVLRPVTLAAPVTGSARGGDGGPAGSGVRGGDGGQTRGVETHVPDPVLQSAGSPDGPTTVSPGSCVGVASPSITAIPANCPHDGEPALVGGAAPAEPNDGRTCRFNKGRHMPQCAQLPPPNPPCGASL